MALEVVFKRTVSEWINFFPFVQDSFFVKRQARNAVVDAELGSSKKSRSFHRSMITHRSRREEGLNLFG
jgi:hypothetical protein